MKLLAAACWEKKHKKFLYEQSLAYKHKINNMPMAYNQGSYSFDY